MKILMTMVCDALLNHERGVANIANRDRAMRATEEGIAKAVRAAFLMDRLPALVAG